MKVLSLFDGMSCGQIALKQLGIIPDIYYASEIDRHVVKQTQLNFPDTVQLGDVIKWKEWDIDWKSIDLVLAGSPCQGFSFAGKQLAFDDPRSKLFFVFVDILNHIKKFNPNVLFLLENVNMKKSHMRIISEYCGVFPVNINSNLVSAQNRNRWYWTNIRTKQVGVFGEIYSDIPQPKDKGIFLRDILESKVDEKYYVSQAVLDRMFKKDYSVPAINPDKTGTLNTKNNSGQMSLDSGTTFVSDDFVFDKKGIRLLKNQKSTCIDAHYHQFPDNHGQRTGIISRSRQEFIKVGINGNLKADQNKSYCFTAGAHSSGYHSDMDLICFAIRGRKDGNQHLEPQSTGKTNCLTSVQKDNMVLSGTIRSFGGKHFREIKSGKSACITARARNDGDCLPSVLEDFRIRRLTPTECSRLQTVPSWYKWDCSDTQIYKMLGNGWTIDVIVWILSFMKKKFNINVDQK